MKQYFLLIGVLLLASCSRSPVNKFIDTYNQDAGTFSLTIPAWLVRAGTSSSFDQIADDEDKIGFRDIAKSLGKIRVLAAKEEVIPDGAVKQLIKDTRNDDYEEYVTVREKGKTFNIMVKQEKDRVKNLLLLISSDEEFVIAQIDSDISITDLENAQISWNEKRRKEKVNK